jgi:hypothetical protein
MTTQRPDQTTLEKLIALGQCADGDARIGEFLGALKADAYVVSIHPFQDFEWLRDIPWSDACAVVRAVVHVEAARLTKSGGSVSAVKDAFRTMEDCDRVAAMELAAWIVDDSDNDYIPFPMRKIRHAFENIKRTAGSWAECREALDRWCADEWGRQRRVAEELANQKEGEHRRQIHTAVAARLSAEQVEIQHARASAREKLLAELRGLPVRERLEHIAWDDTRSLSCYPADLAVCTADDLKQLDPVTRGRFVAQASFVRQTLFVVVECFTCPARGGLQEAPCQCSQKAARSREREHYGFHEQKEPFRSDAREGAGGEARGIAARRGLAAGLASRACRRRVGHRV